MAKSFLKKVEELAKWGCFLYCGPYPIIAFYTKSQKGGNYHVKRKVQINSKARLSVRTQIYELSRRGKLSSRTFGITND